MAKYLPSLLQKYLLIIYFYYPIYKSHQNLGHAEFFFFFNFFCQMLLNKQRSEMSWPILSEIWCHPLASLYNLRWDNMAVCTRVSSKDNPRELTAFVNGKMAQHWYNIKLAHVVELGEVLQSHEWLSKVLFTQPLLTTKVSHNFISPLPSGLFFFDSPLLPLLYLLLPFLSLIISVIIRYKNCEWVQGFLNLFSLECLSFICDHVNYTDLYS